MSLEHKQLKSERGYVHYWIKKITKNWQGTVIVSVIWIVLGWLYAFGIQAVFLLPLNFLTGALSGIGEDTSITGIIGSLIGRTILLAFINGFITTLIIHKGSFGERWKEATKHFKKSLTNVIPFFTNLREFDFKTTGGRWLNISGMGFGLAVYAFISGNGEFINSFVVLVVFIMVVQEAAEKRGILTALLNFALSRNGKRRISRQPVEAFINGYGIGMLLAIIYAFFVHIQWIAYLVGGGTFIMSLLAFWIHRSVIRKEMNLCKES